MKTKGLVLLALYYIISFVPLYIGIDSVSMLFLSALLVITFLIYGPAIFGGGCILSAVMAFLCRGFNIESAALFIAVTIPMAFVMALSISKRCKFVNVLLLSSLTELAAFSGMIFYLMRARNASAMQVIFGSALDTLKEATAAANLGDVADVLTAQIDLMLPSLLIISVVCFTYFTFGTARGWLKRNGLFLPMPYFRHLRLGRGFALLFLAITLLSLFTGVDGIALNIVTVTGFLFIACGISVCDFFLESRGVKTFLRIIIYVGVFLCMGMFGIGAAILSMGLFLLGMFDSFKPLRKPKQQNNTEQ